MTKVALITGITGQDGSYLAELLLEKEYIVWGIIRRSSDINTHRIDHLYENKSLILRYGDLSDSANLLHIMYEIKSTYPDMNRLEVYNLGAMSHVKVSFDMPEYCGNVDGLGVLRLLEAIRSAGLQNITRFYQASTSELYGKVQEVPQSEKTPFYPRSPYGVSKLYGYWIVKNYRESYNMYATNGTLFNHETLGGFMPLIFKDGDEIDIKPISEIVRHHTLNNGILVDELKGIYQEGFVERELYVWDNNDWTRVKFASGYPHDKVNDNKNARFIVSRSSIYLTTEDHEIIMEDDSEKKTKDIEIGDKVKLVNYPEVIEKVGVITNDEAEYLGAIIYGGEVDNLSVRYIGKSMVEIDYIRGLYDSLCRSMNRRVELSLTELSNRGYMLKMDGFNDFFSRYRIYNEDGTKRIPREILNGGMDIKMRFLAGYNFVNVNKLRTKSAVLAQGLLFLLNDIKKGDYNINIEFCKGKIYYVLNVNKNLDKNIENNKIKKLIDYKDYDGWFYDLETESGKFQAGIGRGRIHNSPRRGPTFVTRKVTRGLNMILKGERDRLVLGNLDAKRDWGRAKDYVRGMYLILQQDNPDDYVLSTNEFHSVREFVELAFSMRGFDIGWRGEGINEVGYDKKTGRELIFVSEKYFRPAEVEELLGDSTKARRELGWIPEYSFIDLVREMVECDCVGI